MTGNADSRLMSAGQNECRRTMIECRRLPRTGIVAATTIVTEVVLGMIRVCRRGEA